MTAGVAKLLVRPAPTLEEETRAVGSAEWKAILPRIALRVEEEPGTDAGTVARRDTLPATVLSHRGAAGASLRIT